MRNIGLIILLLASQALCQADEPSMTREEFSATVESIFENILDQHIEPPTRQEMALALIRRLRANETPSQVADLAKTVSELSGKEQLYHFMREEVARSDQWQELAAGPIDELDLSWLSPRVLGGIRLISAKDADVEKQLAANRYVGIGVHLTKTDSKYFFPNVLENGTAAKAGILSGDQLLAINNRPVSGNLEDIVDQLRGPEGSEFHVTVQTGDENPREVELRRQVVVMKTVRLEPHSPGSAQVFIDNMKASTPHELEQLVSELPESVTEITLHLRFDGNFHYFVLLSDALLDEGVLGEMVTRSGKQKIRTTDGNIFGDRTFRIRLADGSEQQKLLRYLALREDARVIEEDLEPVEPLYLRESLPILDGKAVMLLATRRFQKASP